MGGTDGHGDGGGGATTHGNGAYASLFLARRNEGRWNRKNGTKWMKCAEGIREKVEDASTKRKVHGQRTVVDRTQTFLEENNELHYESWDTGTAVFASD